LDVVLNDLDQCFKQFKNKYYNVGKKTIFDPLHSGHYIIFLSFLAKYLSLQLQEKNASR